MPDAIIETKDTDTWSQEKLNAFKSDIEKKLEDTKALKTAFDEAKSENEGLNSKIQLMEKRIVEMEEVSTNRFVVKSEDEKLHDMGQFMKACYREDNDNVYKLGGKIQKAKETNQEWKEGHWNITGKELDLDSKAAVGTPLTSDTTTGSYLAPTEWNKTILRIPSDPSSATPTGRR